MADRSDAAAAAFAFAVQLNERFSAAVGGPDTQTVWTIGQFVLHPGAASIV
jgi:hypothetical protein